MSATSEQPQPSQQSSVQFVEIEGFDSFVKHYESAKSEVYYYFSGQKKDGVSWCPDCSEAEPIVKNVLADVKKHIVFVYVDVGNREYWKDPQCPFRTDKRTKLMVIPTIIKWNGVQRLEGSQCSKPNLLTMLFEEE